MSNRDSLENNLTDRLTSVVKTAVGYLPGIGPVLSELGLIEYRVHVDSSTKMPEFDRFTGRPKTSSPMITTLGRMLLAQIGIMEKLY